MSAAPALCGPLTLRGHTGPLLCLAFHPLRPALLASSSEAELLLWDLACPQAPALARAAGSAALGLAQGAQQLQWWPGGGELALLLGSGVRVLLASLAPAEGAAAGAAAAAPALLLATCGDDVAALCLHPTLPLCAACDDEGAVTLIGLPVVGAPPPAALRVLRKGGHTSLCTGALFSPCGAVLVSGGCDQRLLVWESAAAAAAKAPLLDESLPDLLLLQSLEGSGSGGGDEASGFGPGVNPPHILSLVAGPARQPPAPGSKGSSLLAVALGDGAVAVVELSWALPQRRGGAAASAAPRPSLAVQWVDRSSVSPACALASVEVGSSSSSSAGGGSAAPPRSLLVSASNSGTLRAWDWAALAGSGGGRGSGGVAPLATWAHGEEGAKRRKINWLAGSPAFGGLLAVADTGRRVTVYALEALLPPGK